MTQTNGGAGWTVPGSGVLSVTLTGALAMGSGAANACQGATFTVHLRWRREAPSRNARRRRGAHGRGRHRVGLPERRLGARRHGAAAASSVNQGATPTASAPSTTVTVSWSATTLANGQAVSGYLVKRYDAATLAAQTVLLGVHRDDHRHHLHRDQRPQRVVEVHRHPGHRHELAGRREREARPSPSWSTPPRPPAR